MKASTACVTCVWAGVDSAWRQKNLEAGKLPVNRVDSHPSAARGVGQFLMDDTLFVIIGDYCIAFIGDAATPKIGVIA